MREIMRKKFLKIILALFFVVPLLCMGRVVNASMIPSMTGDTSPSPYVASASSVFSGSFPAYKAFDGVKASSTSIWFAATASAKLKIDQGDGNAKAASAYAITSHSTSGSTTAPKDWTLEGSNDDMTWTVLDTQAGISPWSGGETKGFSFTNGTAYRYYRLNVSANNGNSRLIIQEFELEEGSAPPPPAVVISNDPPPVMEYKMLLPVSFPGKMTQGTDGNIYVADSRENRVEVFDRYGKKVRDVTTVARPSAVAADPVTGTVYVASDEGLFSLGDSDRSTAVIEKGILHEPSDMAVDSAGNLYVVDRIAGVVKVFTSASVHLADFGNDAVWYPRSIAIAQGAGSDGDTPEDLVYVGYSVEKEDSNNNNMVIVYDLGRNVVRSFGVPFMSADGSESAASPDPAYITRVDGIAVDGEGRVYLADSYGNRVTVFDRVGAYMTTLPVREVPNGVIVDQDGRLILSTLSGMVKVYTVDGKDVPNAPPTVPTFISPVGGVRTKTGLPTLIAGNSSDANGDPLTYEFQVASDLFMSDLLWTSPLIPEGGEGKTRVALSVPLQEDSSYYWCVRSFDGKEYSPYSQKTSFFVNAVNSVPVIDSFSPEMAENLDVGTTIVFNLEGHDRDRDNLTTTWFLDGNRVSSGPAYIFEAGSEHIGTRSVTVTLADAQLSVSDSRSFTVYRPNTVASPPAPNTPVEGVDVATLQPVLTVSNSPADAEGDARHYLFEVSAVSDFSVVADTIIQGAEGANTTSASVTVALTDNTRYYWRSKICDVHQSADIVRPGTYCSGYSQPGSFFVNTVNDISTTPGISYPADGVEVGKSFRETPVLSITKSEDKDVNDTLTYEFEIAADASFEGSIFASITGLGSSSDSGEVFWVLTEKDLTLEDNSIYYWRARARDNHGAESGWATAWFFVNMANDDPSVPMAVYPAPGAEINTTTTPALVVGNSLDPDLDTLSYTFELDRVNTFSSEDKRVMSFVAEGAGTTLWTTPILSDNTEYFWRVKANDGAADSPWMTAASFFINTENDAPPAPTLKSPVSGLEIKTVQPELSLYDVIDIDRDVLRYIYEVSTEPTFDSYLDQSELTGNRWTLNTLLNENGYYFWRARAVDEHALEGAWSLPGQFMVNVANDAPTAPVIAWQSFDSGTEAVLEIGNSFDADGDLLTYEVEIYSDRQMTRLAGSVINLSEGMDGETIWNAGRFSNGLYYWRARAWDGEVYGSWSGTRIFRVSHGGGTDAGNAGGRIDKAYGRRMY